MNNNLERYGDIIELSHTIDTEAAIAEIRALDSDHWKPEKTRSYVDFIGDNNQSYRESIETSALNNIAASCPTISNAINLFDNVYKAKMQRIDAGSFFEPHRDHMQGGTKFRVFLALNNTTRDKYAFFYEDRIIEFKPGVPYIINTAKVHGAMSFADETYHLLMTVSIESDIKKIIDMVTFR